MEGMINYQNKKNRITPWLNQYYATSGNVPSENVLNQIIQSELEQAYQDRMRQQQLALQREQLDAQKSMWDAQRVEWRSARKDRDKQMLWSGISQLGTSALGLLGKEGLSDIAGWVGDKWNKGTEYAKNALGFGTPTDYSVYGKDPAGETDRAWSSMPESKIWEGMVKENPNQNIAFSYNTQTPSTPVRQGGATPVRPVAAMPTGAMQIPLTDYKTPPPNQDDFYNPYEVLQRKREAFNESPSFGAVPKSLQKPVTQKKTAIELQREKEAASIKRAQDIEAARQADINRLRLGRGLYGRN